MNTHARGLGRAARLAGLWALLLAPATAVAAPADAAGAPVAVPAPAPAPQPGGLIGMFATAAPAPATAPEAPLVQQYQEGGALRRQSSPAHALLFWIGAAAALLGAIAVIVARRPMRSALGLLVAVLATAGLYVLLRAELLAALQVLIYAGAVVVLLVFVITFLDQGAIPAPGGRRLPVRVLSVAAIIYVLYLIAHEVFALGLGTRLVPGPEFGTTAGVGRALFSTYLVPFEAIAALLLTAIVGAVAVARGKDDGGGTGATATPAATTTTTTTTTSEGGGE